MHNQNVSVVWLPRENSKFKFELSRCRTLYHFLGKCVNRVNNKLKILYKINIVNNKTATNNMQNQIQKTLWVFLMIKGLFTPMGPESYINK